MEFINWSDDYCVGNNLIDIQHKLFFEMVKDITKRVESGKQDVSAKEIILFLQDYVDMHFSAEEAIMSETHYPDLHNHQAIHSEFSNNIQQLHDQLDSEEVSHILDKVLTLTQNWFLEHILTQDKQLTKYLH